MDLTNPIANKLYHWT